MHFSTTSELATPRYACWQWALRAYICASITPDIYFKEAAADAFMMAPIEQHGRLRQGKVRLYFYAWPRVAIHTDVIIFDADSARQHMIS